MPDIDFYQSIPSLVIHEVFATNPVGCRQRYTDTKNCATKEKTSLSPPFKLALIGLVTHPLEKANAL